MKLNIQNITSQIQPLIDALKRYSVLIFVIAFVGMYSFLITRINTLTQSEPTVLPTDQQTIQRLKIDQESVDKILELEEHNIEVKTLFEQARNNPFTE